MSTPPMGHYFKCRECEHQTHKINEPCRICNGMSFTKTALGREAKVYKPKCALCGEALTVVVKKDKTYEGADYFGDVPEFGEYWECKECALEPHSTKS